MQYVHAYVIDMICWPELIQESLVLLRSFTCSAWLCAIVHKVVLDACTTSWPSICVQCQCHDFWLKRTPTSFIGQAPVYYIIFLFVQEGNWDLNQT